MSAVASQSEVLPRLREDLRLLAPSAGERSTSSWRIYDPAQHRYFEIDRATAEVLKAWGPAGTREATAQAAGTMLGRRVDVQLVHQIVAFAESHGLTQAEPGHGWRAVHDRAVRSRRGVALRLLHGYIFFRVPLVRPDRFLDATLAMVKPLFSRAALAFVVSCGLIGLYLVGRQWDAFVATAAGFFSVEGAILISLALVIVKALHELGHAYTAKRYGCRVPVIGVAFILLLPLLYCDVTDAWRLPERRRRFAIAAAGIAVETALACLATLAWALLADGWLRQLAFAIATTSWILSLAFNLNPLMRFDGYYMLSDALGVVNLQERSFALGRWRLREGLFGLREPPPEVFSAPMRNGLLAYAWSVWIYRLLLFVGIALVVYHMFFKLLGLALFAVEVLVLVARPIWLEMKAWFQMREKILERRRWILTSGGLLVVIAAMAAPVWTRVEVPAILERSALARIWPPKSAVVASVHVRIGDAVTVGSELITLHSDAIESELRMTHIRLELAKSRINRQAGDTLDKAEAIVLSREVISLNAKLAALAREQEALVVRAPISGVVLELDSDLVAGRIVRERQRLALIGDGAGGRLRGYAQELDVPRLQAGAPGRFIPDDLTEPSLAVRLLEVGAGAAKTIEIAELSARNGGPIGERAIQGKAPEPAIAIYPAHMVLAAQSPLPGRQLRGVALLEGTAESLLGRAWRHAAGVLVRETGF